VHGRHLTQTSTSPAGAGRAGSHTHGCEPLDHFATKKKKRKRRGQRRQSAPKARRILQTPRAASRPRVSPLPSGPNKLPLRSPHPGRAARPWRESRSLPGRPWPPPAKCPTPSPAAAASVSASRIQTLCVAQVSTPSLQSKDTARISLRHNRDPPQVCHRPLARVAIRSGPAGGSIPWSPPPPCAKSVLKKKRKNQRDGNWPALPSMARVLPGLGDDSGRGRPLGPACSRTQLIRKPPPNHQDNRILHHNQSNPSAATTKPPTTPISRRARLTQPNKNANREPQSPPNSLFVCSSGAMTPRLQTKRRSPAHAALVTCEW